MTNENQQSFGDEVIERIAENNEDAIVLEPRSTYNRAIIGSDIDDRVVYSVEKIIRALMEDWDIDETDALEHFEYNTLGTFRGMQDNNKPLFIYEDFVV
tara:strand:- start:332 stop:628 length:297 start_codon:yes stop_codon:yes gene_type:complete